MSDEFRYDPESGTFRPKSSPPPRPQKKDNDLGSWLIIAFLFFTGLWPLGLVLLIGKLSDGRKKTQARRTPVQQAAPKAAEPEKKTAAQKAKQTAKKAASSPTPTDQTARTLTIIGAVATVIFGAGLLSTIGEGIAYGFLGYMWEDILSTGGFLAAGLVTLFSGRRMKKRARRFARYLAILGERDSVSIDELCTAAGKRRSTVERDLDVMLDKGFLGELAYYDEGRGMLYRSSAARSAEVLREQEKAAQEKAAQEESRPAEGDYNAYLAAIRRANDRIPDEALSEKMDRMEDITRRIFREIEQHPEKKPQASRFLDYYLPTTLKLLETYADFDEAGVEGENLRQAKNRIETIMDSLVAGFEHQLDELYRNEAMDVDSDIRVMESMLRRDTATVADDFGLGASAAVRRFPDEE